MHAHDAVIDFATTPQPLTPDADSLLPALGRPLFVKAADGLDVSVVSRNELLCLVPQPRFVPFDRFEKTLQRARGSVKPQGNCFGVLPLFVGKLSLNVDS